MTSEELRGLQAPWKAKYRENPETATTTLHAMARLDPQNIACRIETGKAQVVAGLHPATGGDGNDACSGDMLLEALAACAGVTLRAVATAMEIQLRGGTVTAEGDLDWRGTLGLAKDVPVGFRAIRLRFSLDTDAPPDRVAKLIELTERYCVVYQTFRRAPDIAVSVQ